MGALRRLAQEQYRLGLEPRALLGHAAPDLAHRAGDVIVVGGVEELRELAMDPVPDDLHRPYIDTVRIGTPRPRTRTASPRSSTWFDSGSMPFAQWAYPYAEGSQENFERHFPADYICEAVDQTRGWFYSLHAISTMLFGRTSFKTPGPGAHPGRRGEEDEQVAGQRQTPGTSSRNRELTPSGGRSIPRRALATRAAPNPVDDAVRKYLLTLWNTYSFFVTYARIDGFDPRGSRPSG